MRASYDLDDPGPGDLLPRVAYLPGWCPECGRRRSGDARCANCDPWWTSPIIQAGLPVLIGIFFVVTSASAWMSVKPKPSGVAASRAAVSSRPVTVQVPPGYQPSTASVAPSVRPPAMPAARTGAMDLAVRAQREGAYINAVLQAQDRARRAWEVAARNQSLAAQLQQQRRLLAAQEQARRFATPLRFNRSAVPVIPAAPIEQIITEETVIVPS
ncbi:MAG: hypothetical protein H7Z41_16740 [Cytophagales bacterium]|nr:hypothetical protein [Armatimonadota bacterium]